MEVGWIYVQVKRRKSERVYRRYHFLKAIKLLMKKWKRSLCHLLGSVLLSLKYKHGMLIAANSDSVERYKSFHL